MRIHFWVQLRFSFRIYTLAERSLDQVALSNDQTEPGIQAVKPRIVYQTLLFGPDSLLILKSCTNMGNAHWDTLLGATRYDYPPRRTEISTEISDDK